MNITDVMKKIGLIVTSETWLSLVLHFCFAATIIMSFPGHAKFIAALIIGLAIPKEFVWDVKYEPQASTKAAYISGIKDFTGYLLGSLYAAWKCGVFG